MLPLVYHSVYSPTFPKSHRFPMEKFALLAKYLQEIGLLNPRTLFTPEPISDDLLELAHCAEYIQAYRTNGLTEKAMRRIGLPWSVQGRDRTFQAVGGSLLTAKLAIRYGLAAHLAGGTHHAHFDFGSGFCIFNDLAVIAKSLIAEGLVHRVLIIDCDVHQGDGTARILTDEETIFTCSVHCRQNFPVRKAESDFDIEVERGSGGSTYLSILESTLPYIVSVTHPDIILYDAGADVHEDDALGYLNLTDKDIFDRDEYVIRLGLDRDIPVACVIGGGYSRDRIILAKRHGIIHQVASKLFRDYSL